MRLHLPLDIQSQLGIFRRMLPSASQIRAGRGLLGWSRTELASRASVSSKTLQLIEDEAVNPRASTLEALGRALAKGGVLFLTHSKSGGEGVRLALSEDSDLE